jgi:hypothetical protein
MYTYFACITPMCFLCGQWKHTFKILSIISVFALIILQTYIHASSEFQTHHSSVFVCSTHLHLRYRRRYDRLHNGVLFV